MRPRSPITRTERISYSSHRYGTITSVPILPNLFTTCLPIYPEAPNTVTVNPLTEDLPIKLDVLIGRLNKFFSRSYTNHLIPSASLLLHCTELHCTPSYYTILHFTLLYPKLHHHCHNERRKEISNYTSNHVPYWYQHTNSLC